MAFGSMGSGRFHPVGLGYLGICGLVEVEILPAETSKVTL